MRPAFEFEPIHPDQPEACFELTFEVPAEEEHCEEAPDLASPNQESEAETIALTLVHVDRHGYYRLGGHPSIVEWAEEQFGFDAQRTAEMLRWGHELEQRVAEEPAPCEAPPDPAPSFPIPHVVGPVRVMPSPEGAYAIHVRVLPAPAALASEGRPARVTFDRSSPPARARSEATSERGRGAPNVRQPSHTSFSSA